MICGNCGKEVRQGAFCGHCGAPLGGQGSVASQMQQPVQQAMPYQQQAYQQPYVAAPQPVNASVAPNQQLAYGQAAPAQTYQAQPVTPSDVVYPRPDKQKTLLMIAFIFNIISTVCWAFSIIGLAWSIPMTVHSYNIYQGKKANTTGFGIACLLVLNMVAGILMLVADKDQ
ncbi:MULTISPECIES: zinc ribbon domain-containing protein [unclassified Adlercreutzia]|uniref:zinc ribbon domain-containing protein n=1 Tax=unclassified Adlercreutzia TaxID=2636013 RepID=UPI0013EBDE91|nr:MULTISPECIES: zinc ribbon domain-containing protein [unclassified Adlercreutzia]